MEKITANKVTDARRHADVLVVGGGQSGLACAYFLNRRGVDYLVLDDQKIGGGAWQHAWDSLTLFSPAEYSSLPGWLMPKSESKFPTRTEVINYLRAYEERYKIPVRRPVSVNGIKKKDNEFLLETPVGMYTAKAVISATGTWRRAYIPDVPGKHLFMGEQIHSANYKNADAFTGKKVLVVGNGNSGAQILAELSLVSSTVWAVRDEPEFLPDDVDGRVLFDMASARYHAMQAGIPFDASQYSLGKIVMVPPVVEARERSALNHKLTFTAMAESGVIWPDGTTETFDSIVWCTGFHYATDYLSSLVLLDDEGKAETSETASVAVPGLFFVGYGGWTGFASATLVGVGRSAKNTVNKIMDYLNTVR